MTIQDLYTLLKSKECEPFLMHWSSFKNQTIAIDTPSVLHRYGKSSGYQWLKEFTIFVCMLRKYNITPVFIYDGNATKDLKTKEREKRIELRNKTLQRLDQEREWLYSLRLHNSVSPTDRENILTCLRRKKKKVFDTETNKWKFKNDEVPNDISVEELISRLQESIEKGEKQTTLINNDYVVKSMAILEACGIPSIQVDYEAEAVAARLMNSGYVHAVFTEDSDALAYGCNRVLCMKQLKMSDERVLVYELPNILSTLNMSFEKFQDLCILLGMDYNERTVGYPPDGKKYKKPRSIGVKAAWTIMEVCDTLEEAIERGYIVDPEPLKIQECRHALTHDMVYPKPRVTCKPPNIIEINNLLQETFCTLDEDYLYKCLSPVL